MKARLATFLILLFIISGVGSGFGSVTARAEDPAPVPQAVSTSTRYQVTFAARSCGDYSQVMAARVRDDATEAPQSPGQDSIYSDGQAVSPDVEAAAGAGCSPLTGWTFTLGTGRQRVGALSTVTDPVGDSGSTQAQVPLLDGAGRDTGKTLAGAVTVALDPTQLAPALKGRLYVQGGTPDDPLLGQSQPGYQFGALRCGTDGRLDTNTQWIGFRTGVRHVFCFAYYVKTAAPTGTLLLQARTTRDVGYPQRFGFSAPMSYTTDHTVTLATGFAPVTETLVRTAGGDPTTVTPMVPDGWRLSDAGCTATGAGASVATVDPAGGATQITLAPNEIVTCVYTFDPPPITAGLSLRVFSQNAAGQFGLGLTGNGATWRDTAAPNGDGSAVAAVGDDLSTLAPGAYTLTVNSTDGDTAWSIGGLDCNGTGVRSSGLTAQISLAIGEPVDCELRMVHTAGSLDLRAVTVGGTGAAAFVVSPQDGDSTWSGVSTTTGYGVPAPAQGTVPGSLPFDSYLVTPLAPQSTADGSWQLDSFTCDQGNPAAQGQNDVLLVRLAAGSAHSQCVATFDYVTATQLQVVLRFAGDGSIREAPASVQVTCDDGSHGTAVLGADDATQQALPTGLGFLGATHCTVEAPSMGVSDAPDSGGNASYSAEVDPPSDGAATLTLPGEIDISPDVTQYTVTVTITYTADETVPKQAQMLSSTKLLPVTLIGAGLVGLGLVILLVMVIRSRSA